MGLAVFKTVGGHRRCPRWVRLPSTPARNSDGHLMPKETFRRLITSIAVLLLVMLAAGLIVWGTIIVLASRQVTVSAKPTGLPINLRPHNIDAPLALQSLAGTSDIDIVAQALSQGKRDTALAILTFAHTPSDLQRASALLILAQDYATNGEGDKAAYCWRLLINLAILSTELHDYQKANLLLQAGAGMQSMGRWEEAEDAYDRVLEIARYSPMLQPPHRILLLNILAPKYAQLDRPAKAQEAIYAAGDPAPAGNPPRFNASLPVRSPYWEESPAWAQVAASQAERRRLAGVYAAALAEKRATEEERQALSESLLAEDEAWNQWHEEQSQQAASLGQQSAVARAWVGWLLLKWRVASQGFGLSLIPEWEAQAKEIQSELRRAWEDDYTLRLELAASLPDPLAARQAVVDILLEEIKMGRLGLYPNAPERGLVGDLAEAVRDRISLQRDDTLYVVGVTRTGAGTIGFVFANADRLLPR